MKRALQARVLRLDSLKSLDALAQAHDRLEVFYVVGDRPDAPAIPGWSGETGWIDQEKIRRLAFPPAPDTAIWICGVDEMYKSLAGSRMKPLTPESALTALGYSDEMVWRS